MDLSPVNILLLGMSVAGQLILFLLVLRQGLRKTFPIFTSYLLYASISDVAFVIFFRHLSELAYFEVYFADKVLEVLFQLCILMEVAFNVLSPVRRSLPRTSIYVFVIILSSGALLSIFLSLHSSPDELTAWSRHFVQMNYSVAILQLVIFTAITVFSQMLGIGWKNHVLQLATGFAGYSFVVLAVELLHRFMGVTNDPRYRLQEQMKTVGWCVALLYWSYSLSKKEVTRKEFTPKMAQFLVSITGAGRSNRDRASGMYRK